MLCTFLVSGEGVIVMANNIQLYHIGPIEFPSLDINSVEGKWAADCVAHERQQIKRNRLMQDMLETGLWEEMTAAKSKVKVLECY